MVSALTFRPDWVSPPGDTIADAIDEQGLTQTELATRTGFTRKHVNDLVRGRAAISADTAVKLEAVLGGDARFWLSREAHFREAQVRRARLDSLRSCSAWLKELPLADMVRLNWVRKRSHKGEQVEECLRFFAVADTSAWEAMWHKPLAAFRTSERVGSRFGAVAAWLRAGEREASKQLCAPFERSAVMEVLRELRALTLERDPDVFVPKLKQTCREVGISVVLVPTPKGCPASGATKWLAPDKAMLALSLRYKTNDHLWFSFFHECGHLLQHGKRLLFLEGTETISAKHEDEADRFARNLLIPPKYAANLPSLGFSKRNVTRFARDVGVAPGIVVGRMQWAELLPWTHLNGLKVRYEWSNTER